MSTPLPNADSADHVPAIEEPLRLEYTCTPAEIKEAEDLGLCQSLGGGSKWLAGLVLLLILLLILVPMFFLLWTHLQEIAPWYRVGGFILIVVAATALTLWQNRKNQRGKTGTVAEITAQEVRFHVGTAQAVWPWSALGKIIESETLFVVPLKKGAMSLVFPKRVFPDDHARDWFRAVASASGQDVPTDQPTSAPDAHERESVTIEFRLRYRDYLDRSLASWFSRGGTIFFVAFTLGTLIVLSWEPNPQAVCSRFEVFLFFLPFIIIGGAIFPVIAATRTWLNHWRMLVPQTVTLSEHGLSTVSSEERSTVRWETRTLYKETRWNFLVWWPGTQAWVLLPKRAYPSLAAIDRCREILAQHATRSTWFFG